METKTTYTELKCNLVHISDFDSLKTEIIKEVPDVTIWETTEGFQNALEEYYEDEFVNIRIPYKNLSFYKIVRILQKYHEIDLWTVKFITE